MKDRGYLITAVVMTLVFPVGYKGGSGVAEGLRFDAVIGLLWWLPANVVLSGVYETTLASRVAGRCVAHCGGGGRWGRDRAAACAECGGHDRHRGATRGHPCPELVRQTPAPRPHALTPCPCRPTPPPCSGRSATATGDLSAASSSPGCLNNLISSTRRSEKFHEPGGDGKWT